MLVWNTSPSNSLNTDIIGKISMLMERGIQADIGREKNYVDQLNLILIKQLAPRLDKRWSAAKPLQEISKWKDPVKTASVMMIYSLICEYTLFLNENRLSNTGIEPILGAVVPLLFIILLLIHPQSYSELTSGLELIISISIESYDAAESFRSWYEGHMGLRRWTALLALIMACIFLLHLFRLVPVGLVLLLLGWTPIISNSPIGQIETWFT